MTWAYSGAFRYSCTSIGSPSVMSMSVSSAQHGAFDAQFLDGAFAEILGKSVGHAKERVVARARMGK